MAWFRTAWELRVLDDGSAAWADPEAAEGFFHSLLGPVVKRGTRKNTGVEMMGQDCG